MKPPPGTPSLDFATPQLAALFERAFAPESVRDDYRPKSDDWLKALELLAKSLRACSSNTGHQYWSQWAKCPWCEVEALSGTVIFRYSVNIGGPGREGVQGVGSIWALILGVPAPNPSRPLADLSAYNTPPSAVAQQRLKQIQQSAQERQLKQQQQAHERRFMAVGAVAAAIVLCFFVGFDVGFWVVVAAILFALFVTNNIPETASFHMQSPEHCAKEATKRDFQRTAKLARDRMKEARNQWQNGVCDAAFCQKRSELEAKKATYDRIGEIRKQKKQKLEADKQQNQLERYLDRFRIFDATIKGIGPAKKATLQSYGIETAADIIPNRILALPGFGPALTDTVVYWRRGLERRFRFDPRQSIDPKDIAAVDREITQIRMKTEQELLQGKANLERISREISARQSALWQIADTATREAAQAVANLSLFQ